MSAPRTAAGLHPTGTLPRATAVARGAGRHVVAGARWGWLALAWGLYYFAVHSVGRYEQYTQKSIWLGGLAVGALTILTCQRHLLRIPTEVKVLACLLLWILTGLPEVYSSQMFFYFVRLLVQLAVMILLMVPVMRRSGGDIWLYTAFLATAAFNVLLAPGGGGSSLMATMRTQTRQDALGGGPNTLGWYGFLGLLGALVLIGQVHKTWQRALVVGGAFFALVALVSAASRGAFVATVLAFMIWPVLCLRIRVRQIWLYALVALLLVGVGYAFTQYVYSGSLLSERMEQSAEKEYEEDSRSALMLLATKVFLRNPINGVGLGQFGYASGTGQYSHAEGPELLATTGLVGLALYWGIYYFAWRRLTRSLRRVRNPLLMYRINCARMTLLVLWASGIFFKPHFLVISSQFLIAMAVGMSYWAEAQAKALAGDSGPMGDEVYPTKLGGTA